MKSPPVLHAQETSFVAIRAKYGITHTRFSLKKGEEDGCEEPREVGLP
jgi:hypothetical protein